MQKTKINVSGMHCKSCEILVEGEIKKINGIEKVNVSYQKGTAEIIHSEVLDTKEIETAVKKAGYSLFNSNENFPLIKINKNDYQDLGIAFLILIIIALLLDQFGILKLNFVKGNGYGSLAVVILVGLTAGFSTCMALVGGILLALSANFAKDNPNLSFQQKFTPHLFFNLGRVFFFFLLGGITGLAGSILKISPTIQGMFTIILSIIMIFLGLNLLNIFPGLKSIFTLPKKLADVLKINEKKDKLYSHSNSFLLGGLTFFLPCGFTQAMQLYAVSTGSFMKGALTMSVFALGTIPGLLTVGTISSFAKGSFGRVFFKFAGLVVIALALFNINGGLNLTGFNISANSQNITKSETQYDPNVTVENGVQIVRMNQVSNGYEPNFFTIKKGMPVRWIIDSQAPYSCAASIVVPQLKISKLLQKGDNTIEFTPEETGLLKFTCSMGMYSGTFNVVDDKETLDINKINETKVRALRAESSEISLRYSPKPRTESPNKTIQYNPDVAGFSSTGEATKPKSGCGCNHGT